MQADFEQTPFTEDLKRAVSSLYDQCGCGHFSKQLEVCLCPVCMTQETYRKLLATENTALPCELICEYTNSAHGVPQNLEDLRLMLPRYAELLALDTMVDYVGSGTELHRFGEALKQNPDFLNQQQYAAFRNWAFLWIQHIGYLEAKDRPCVFGLFNLLETLITGGLRVSDVTSAFDAAFANETYGETIVVEFWRGLIHQIRQRSNKKAVEIDLFSSIYWPEASRSEFIEWQNSNYMLDLYVNSIEKIQRSDKQNWRLLWLEEKLGSLSTDDLPQEP